MSGTYGAAGQNRFTIPNVTGFFSTIVNSQTGVTQVYRQGAFTTESSIGTYNPSTGAFTPQRNSSLTAQEITRIQSQQGINSIRNAAVTTATNAGATNAAQLISPNTSSSAQTQSRQGASVGPTSGGISNLTSLVRDAPGGVRMNYGSYDALRYPLNRDAKQDYIKFTMLRYSPRAFDTRLLGTGSPFGSRGSRTTLGSVSLPIQPTISDSNSVVWGEDKMTNIDAAVQAVSLEIMGQGDLDKLAGDLSTGVANNADGLKALTAYQLAQAAASGQGNLLTRTTGGIVNPNLELLFQGPVLRPFSFSFSMSARNSPEAQVIRKIIRFFKQGMSVKRANTALFLMSPNTFEISYIYGETTSDHPWINKIKECALQNFTVNYTPEGNYSTYEDGAMTKYDIGMSFSELEPIYDDDYLNLNDNDATIGY